MGTPKGNPKNVEGIYQEYEDPGGSIPLSRTPWILDDYKLGALS